MFGIFGLSVGPLLYVQSFMVIYPLVFFFFFSYFCFKKRRQFRFSYLKRHGTLVLVVMTTEYCILWLFLKFVFFHFIFVPSRSVPRWRCVELRVVNDYDLTPLELFLDLSLGP